MPPAFLGAPDAAARQRDNPRVLAFGLQVSRFDFPGHPGTTGETLAALARVAEEVGFDEPVGDGPLPPDPAGRAGVGGHARELDDARPTSPPCTERIRLGTLVTGITYRNVAHLAKIVATLDVLSGGRADLRHRPGWFEQRAPAYGWPFPPPRERYALLEDALELLPLMWGPGGTAVRRARAHRARDLCYPRPLQAHVPILVGGSGERRTLRLVAEHADACNLFGEPDVVRAQGRRAARALRRGGPRSGARSPSPTWPRRE